MKERTPKPKESGGKHGDDRQGLNEEMMELYKREKVNPAAGCLPIVIQIPVFFALYKTLFVSIEMRHAPFYGWIRDLSAPDPTSMFNMFGLIPWDPPQLDRQSTRLNSSHYCASRMASSACKKNKDTKRTSKE